MKGKHKKAKKALVVEDHGNGFMVIGTTDYRKAGRYLAEHYVDNGDEYRFATPTWYEDQPAVWLTTGPGEHWEGARGHDGSLLPR